ncbi:hypothetical protein KJ682_07940 [bacterium]|nr:hypothetical protein [bacterium]
MPPQILEGFDVKELDELGNPVFAVDGDLTMVYANPAYFDFARDNGGGSDFADRWGIGCNILEAMPANLESYFRKMFSLCLEQKAPWDHQFECSSPERFRLFNQRVYPLGERSGLVVLNSLVTEVRHDPAARPPQTADPAVYCDDRGLVHQCVQCRRILRQGEAHEWDWVPAWVATPPPEVTHGFCPVCLDFYYPRDEADQD